MPRYFNVKGIVFSTNGAEAIELLHKKKKLQSYFTSYKRMN